nr:truncated histo-blood group ABO system transferase [Homo sapiens]
MAEVLRTLAGKPKCHALRPMILFLIMLVLVLFGYGVLSPRSLMQEAWNGGSAWLLGNLTICSASRCQGWSTPSQRC